MHAVLVVRLFLSPLDPLPPYVQSSFRFIIQLPAQAIILVRQHKCPRQRLDPSVVPPGG